MHLTLHLTSGCNMRCNYCYAPPAGKIDMPEETLLQALDFAATRCGPNVGIVFFGGEPLLKRNLIAKALASCRDLERKNRVSFHFKVTTNGLLLDEEFLDMAAKERVLVAMSLDGIRESHDRHRLDAGGNRTFDLLERKAELLLKYQPYAYVLMTVTPETVPHYAASVEFLLAKGFRYLIVSLNYAGNWKESDLEILKREYGKIAKLYEKLTLRQQKFYFSPFEKKIASRLQGKDALCQQCHFAVKQVSIAPDGTIYPCVQFVGDGVANRDFAIGDVVSGIDSGLQKSLYELSQSEIDTCRSCALNLRCEHRCSCLNWQTTGKIDGVSAVLCETERIIIPIADRLAERLFRKRAPLFVQKHYNPSYPLLSYMEDRAAALPF